MKLKTKKATPKVEVKKAAAKVIAPKVTATPKAAKVEVELKPLSINEIAKRVKEERVNPKYKDGTGIQCIPNLKGDVLIIEKHCKATERLIELYEATHNKADLCKALNRRHRCRRAFGSLVDFKAIKAEGKGADRFVSITGAKTQG